MSNLTRKILLTIGGEEATPGAGHAMENVVPIRARPTLTRVAQRTPDPAIVGEDFDVGDYLASDSVEGNIPLAPRACAGFGKFLVSLLHTESAPVEIGACIRVRFIGAEASCKIVADTAANTLAAQTGALGAEANDAAWGGGAPLDLTAAANDTVAELVAVIDAYADWACEKVFGADATPSGAIIDRTCQAHDKWVYLWFADAATSAYARHFTHDATVANERPTYAMQLDGMGDNYLYKGIVVDSLSINAVAKGLVEADAAVLGFNETGAQVASVLTLEDVSPLFFWDGSFDINGTVFPYISSISMKYDNKHTKDGYGQGAVGRVYQQRGVPTLTGEIELPLDANTYARRADLFGSIGTYCSTSFYFKGKNIYTGVPEMWLVELPFIQVTSFDWTEKNGVFFAKIGFKGIHPKAAHYDEIITMSLITADAGAY